MYLSRACLFSSEIPISSSPLISGDLLHFTDIDLPRFTDMTCRVTTAPWAIIHCKPSKMRYRNLGNVHCYNIFVGEARKLNTQIFVYNKHLCIKFLWVATIHENILTKFYSQKIWHENFPSDGISFGMWLTTWLGSGTDAHFQAAVAYRLCGLLFSWCASRTSCSFRVHTWYP